MQQQPLHCPLTPLQPFQGFTSAPQTHLRPHSVRDAGKDQRAQAVGPRQAGRDAVPGQVAHRVVVGELQVGLPAQPLLGVLALGGALPTQPLMGLQAICGPK